MRGVRDAQAMWFAALLVLPVAFFSLFHIDELRIAQVERDNAKLVASAANDRALLAQAPALEHERASLQASLRTVVLDAEPTRLVALFVRDAARVASAHHTAITSIAAAGAPAPSPPFDGVALDLIVEGKYQDVLATLRDLTRTQVLAQLDVSALGRKDSSPGASLVATLHVVLNKLAAGSGSHGRAGTT